MQLRPRFLVRSPGSTPDGRFRCCAHIIWDTPARLRTRVTDPVSHHVRCAAEFRSCRAVTGAPQSEGSQSWPSLIWVQAPGTGGRAAPAPAIETRVTNAQCDGTRESWRHSCAQRLWMASSWELRNRRTRKRALEDIFVEIQGDSMRGARLDFVVNAEAAAELTCCTAVDYPAGRSSSPAGPCSVTKSPTSPTVNRAAPRLSRRRLQTHPQRTSTHAQTLVPYGKSPAGALASRRGWLRLQDSNLRPGG